MKSSRCVALLALLVALVGCCCSFSDAHAVDLACKFNDTVSGKYYELHQLAALFTKSNSDSQVDITPPGFKYYVSPCHTVEGLRRCAGFGVCRVAQTGEPTNIGSLTQATTEALTNGREGFRVNMQSAASRTSSIDYVCDEKAGTGHLRWTHLPNPNGPHYEWAFEWRTKFACPV